MLIILDCSQSMWDKWQSDSKIKVTQQVLLRFLDSIQGHTDMEVALRVFGHLNKDAISTQLEVPFASDNAYQLKSKLKTLVPNGGCTAATALDRSLKDFPKDDHARNIILIITDGWIEDHLTIHHKHAYLLPEGRFLPFRPKGEVFYFS